jgi:hypothetical protein
MPTYKHVHRARIDEVIAALELKGEVYADHIGEDQFDLVTIVSHPAEPTRLTVNPEQLETRGVA